MNNHSEKQHNSPAHNHQQETPTLPIINVETLLLLKDDLNIVVDQQQMTVARDIGKACIEFGFFYVIGHGVQEELVEKVLQQTQLFFSLPESIKETVHIRNNKQSYTGYFGVGEELSKGVPDWKEGYSFSSEESGNNQWIDGSYMPDFKANVCQYIDSLTRLGHAIMSGISLSLGLEYDFFKRQFTSNPSIMMRMFHYPPDPNSQFDNGVERWGVPAHKDYGVLTILKQDMIGGLEVEHRQTEQWIPAPPIHGAFVVNIGEMLERWTCGHYKATLHRARNSTEKERYSLPFFFEPNHDIVVQPMEKFLEKEEDRYKYYAIRYGDFYLEKEKQNHPSTRNKL